MRNKEEKRLQRIVAYMCATIFALFSFLFVAVYQSPLIEAFYNHVATGKLNFNGYLWGGIMSVALTLLAVWLNRLVKFRREWTAMAYLPSALLLAFMTDIDRSVYTGGKSYLPWIVIFSVGIIVYLAISFVLRRMLYEKIKNLAMSANRIIWRNLILFVFLFCLTGTLSNGEENFKREALAMSRYKSGDTEGALAVGNRSLDASRELSAIRAYILAEKGMMGERLFEYPQYYGTDGLLPYEMQTSPLVPDSVFALLGGRPKDGERGVEFFKRMLDAAPDNKAALDCYLSALLLEKQVIGFEEELQRLCAGYNPDSLPKHYREALVVLSEFSNDYNLTLKSDTLFTQFGKLREIERKYDDALVRNNYVRKEFGRTYWWYFLYGG